MQGLDINCLFLYNSEAIKQQQYLFAIGGWKPEGRQPIKAGSKM